MHKGKSKFFKIMLCYVAVLAALSIALFIFEWKKLSDYQGSYEAAKEKSAHAVSDCINAYMENFTREYYMDKLSESMKESRYYTKEELAEYKLSTVDFEAVSAVENKQKSNSARYVYDIMAKDKLIATVTLGIAGADDFGFFQWEAVGESFDTDIEYTEAINITVDSDMTVYVNGTVVSDSEAKAVQGVNTVLAERIYELNGKEFTILEYKITELIDSNDVEVKDSSGGAVQYSAKDGVRYYSAAEGSEAKAFYTGEAKSAVESYIKYVNRYITLEEMLACTVPDSQAYNAIDDSWDSTRWIKKPADLKFDSCTVENIYRVGEDMFMADVHYVIERLLYSRYEGETKYVQENIDFSILLRKEGDKWLIDTMSIM